MLKTFNKNNGLVFKSIIVLIVSFLIFTFPNSFREIKLPFILLLFLLSLSEISKLEKVVFQFYLLSLIVTIIYLIVGSFSSKDVNEMTKQVIIVYIVTPLMWSVILNYCFNKYNISTIIRALVYFMIFGCLTVYIGIWLFNSGRIDILQYLMEKPNMSHTDDGKIEMKLHVYGALIFFVPAFMQLYDFYNKKLVFILVLLFIIITAIISGRSALLLSVFLGCLFYMFNKSFIYWAKYIFIAFLGIILVNFILLSFGVNISNILIELYLKIAEGGGKVRNDQAIALYEGINNNIFGAGHGVGVDYIRSFKFPWRYEYLPLATIYRVSLIGFIIYSLPFIYSIIKYFKIKMKNYYDKYMISGYVILLISTFTNPYLESFEFNVFYVLPFIYFVKRDKIIY